MWGQSFALKVHALQLIILLSALLASLSGLMVGERPVQRAQIEQSAPLADNAEAQATPRIGGRSLPDQPINWVVGFITIGFVVLIVRPLATSLFLARKQSWLI
jgi:hypothetical protein